MGGCCSKVTEKAAAAKDKVANTAKSALGMAGSRAVAFGNPIKVFDCEKLQKGETEPNRADHDFMADDNRWSSVREGCIVDQLAFVVCDNELWRVDLSVKDYAKNSTKLDEAQKYTDTKSMVHYDGKLYLFSDTIYKVDVGLGLMAKLPGLPGGDKEEKAKTEAWPADDGIWGDTRCAVMQGKYCYCVCKGKLYRVDLSENDKDKNTKCVNDENWGSAESLFFYDKKLYIVGSKIWECVVDDETKFPRAPWMVFNEDHSFWSPSSFVVGDYAYVAGYNGMYQIKMGTIPSGTKREIKHWSLDAKVVLNFI